MRYYRATDDEVPTQRFTPEEEELVTDYLSRIETVKLGNVIVDIRAFAIRRWECDRFACPYNATPLLNGTCCDGGGIVSPLAEESIQHYLIDAIKYLSHDKCQVLLNEGMVAERHKFREVNGTCVFLAVKGSDRFCALHRVAEDKHIPVFSVKSFDCCLAPLEIIWLNTTELFLTLASNETEAFVRWRFKFPCIEDPWPKAPPIYVATRHLITYIFGPSFYDDLVETISLYKNSNRSRCLTHRGLQLKMNQEGGESQHDEKSPKEARLSWQERAEESTS